MKEEKEKEEREKGNWKYHTFKVMIVGNTGVGKTQIVKTLFKDKATYYSRYSKGICINNLAIDLSIIS